MKQNGQWLSHVCTRSKIACDSSRPSCAPSALCTTSCCSRPPRLTSRSTIGAVDLQLVRDHVPELLAVDGQDLVAGRDSGLLARGTRARQQELVRRASDQDTGKGTARIRRYARIRDIEPPPTRANRAARRAAGLLRRCRDGDQSAGVDGSGLRAARVLLPRDRPQSPRRRALPRTGRGVRGRRHEGARRARR